MSRHPPYRSTFQTFPIGPVATPDAAVVLADAYGRPRRVLLEPVDGVGVEYFVAHTAGELTIPGSTQPGNAYIIGANQAQVLILGPEQALYGVTDTPGKRLAVAISDGLFPWDAEPDLGPMGPPQFRTIPLRADTRLELCGWSKRARRVVVSTFLGGAGDEVRISDKESLLADEFTVTATQTPIRVFILQPEQQLWASQVGPTDSVISVAESEIIYRGVPAPGPEEG